MSKEEFIEQHVAVCSIVGKKKYLIPEGKSHKGTGAYRRVTERQRRRECAKGLWKRCDQLGIEPVLHYSELPS